MQNIFNFWEYIFQEITISVFLLQKKSYLIQEK